MNTSRLLYQSRRHCGNPINMFAFDNHCGHAIHSQPSFVYTGSHSYTTTWLCGQLKTTIITKYGGVRSLVVG
jgi:hypothetical protein